MANPILSISGFVKQNFACPDPEWQKLSSCSTGPNTMPTAARTSERPAPTLLQAPLKRDSNSAATPESESNSVRQPVDFNSNSTQTQNRTIGDREQTCTFNRLRKEIKAAVKLQPAEFDEGVEKNKERASNTAESGTRQSSGHPGAAREGPGPKANRSRSRPFKQQTCYNCGHPGHFKAACTAKNRPSKCGPTCGLCGDNHSTDRCPQLGAASRFVRQSAAGPSTSNVAKADLRDAIHRVTFPVTDATKIVMDDPWKWRKRRRPLSYKCWTQRCPPYPVPTLPECAYSSLNRWFNRPRCGSWPIQDHQGTLSTR